MILKSDCRQIPGDRACRFNNESGQMCADGPHYATAGKRMLIIKPAALGDVLPATVILPGIKAEYSDSAITWLTAPGALDSLMGNLLIDELWALDAEAVLRLTVREFDEVFSPNADPHAASLAAAVKAREKRGMVLHSPGQVIPATPEAETRLEMGAFDQLKKANARTYQELIYQTPKPPHARREISLTLMPIERERASDFLTQPTEWRRSADGSSAGGIREPGFADEPSALRSGSSKPVVAPPGGATAGWLPAAPCRAQPRRGRALEEAAVETASLRRRIGNVRARRADRGPDRLRELLPHRLRSRSGLHAIDRAGSCAGRRAAMVQVGRNHCR